MKNPHKAAKALTIVLLCCVVCWGAVLLLATAKPFWIDEWRLIYNLKFKSAAQLWGPLDFTQQFPRAYLAVIKHFTAALDYSYLSLRLPSLLISVATILLCYRVMKRLYPQRQAVSYLFVLILVSSQTFTDYIVQMKHYEMEILLSIVALWQLQTLLQIGETGKVQAGRYTLLCLSFLFPSFSYTYPIAVAPVFIVIFLQGYLLVSDTAGHRHKLRTITLQWLPLLICIGGIAVFYVTDVAHVMADPEMHNYWQYRMKGEGFDPLVWLARLWGLFAQVGAGALFEVIFGILGVSSFCYALYRLKDRFRYDRDAFVRLYSVVLLLIVIMLFLAGKLPLGEPKFNAFTVPAIAILIIYLLEKLAANGKTKKVATGISVVLFLGLTGNIASTIINSFADKNYTRRMAIYHATENAIRLAQQRNIPIIVTPGVAYPDDIVRVTPFLTNMPAACILMTFPAYSTTQRLPVYTIANMTELKTFMKKLPHGTTEVVAGDGMRYTIVKNN